MRSDPYAIPSGPGETILGDQLSNPYDITTMNAAYQSLFGTTATLLPTHYYIKWLPADGEDVAELSAYEEEHDYEFELQPLHYEVLYDGDEGYIDPAVPLDGGFAPEYGAVTAAHYTANQLPDVPYQLLNAMYIPKYESRLTFAAFVMSGNERFYEAVDGYCHPDCPTWPDCLDDSALTCVPSVVTADVQETVNPFYEGTRSNFPSYITDHGMGGGDGGTVSALEDCPDLPAGHPSLPVCESGYYLHIVQLEPGVCDYICLPIISDPDAGDPPPPGHTSECGCHVYIDDRMPGGRIILEDTQLGGEGVRFVKVKTTKYYWGFVYKNTDTDADGCWKIEKRYNVRRAKVKVVFKDRSTDRMVIRSIRGLRIWNGFIKPVKEDWKIKRSNKKWNDLCFRIEDTDNRNSTMKETFMAATTNNAVHEYFDEYSSGMPSPSKISIVVHTLSDDLQSAPMFSEMAQNQYNFNDTDGWVLTYGAGWNGTILQLVQDHLADVYIPYSRRFDVENINDPEMSDDIKHTVYHEIAHVSQYSQLGRNWWEEYHYYLLRAFSQSLSDPTIGTYGDGTLDDAGRAEVVEGMAFAIADFMAHEQYGDDHSNNLSNPSLNTYDIIGDSRMFWDDVRTFIPKGMFFDLRDITEISGSTVADNVEDIFIVNQVDALDNNQTGIADYRQALWNEIELTSGILQADFDQLFSQYGY